MKPDSASQQATPASTPASTPEPPLPSPQNNDSSRQERYEVDVQRGKARFRIRYREGTRPSSPACRFCQ